MARLGLPPATLVGDDFSGTDNVLAAGFVAAAAVLAVDLLFDAAADFCARACAFAALWASCMALRSALVRAGFFCNERDMHEI